MNDRVEELNSRLATRHFPSEHIEPVLWNMRGTQTRYQLFPVGIRSSVPDPITATASAVAGQGKGKGGGTGSGQVYSPHSCFAPNVKNPPDFQYYVDTETVLRNQCYALQKGADQAVYVPSSNSDLYFETLEASGVLGKDRDRSAIVDISSSVPQTFRSGDRSGGSDPQQHHRPWSLGGGCMTANQTAFNNNTRIQVRNGNV